MSLFDDNTQVLSDLAARGVDLSHPLTVDFEHLLPDQASAVALAFQLSGLGFHTRSWRDETQTWNVTASKVMVPTCEEITAIEEQLDTLARDRGGRADGWGFLEG